jgi:hypothetical protein
MRKIEMYLAKEQLVETKFVDRTSDGGPNAKEDIVDWNTKLIVAKQILIIWTGFIISSSVPSVIVSHQGVDRFLRN